MSKESGHKRPLEIVSTELLTKQKRRVDLCRPQYSKPFSYNIRELKANKDQEDEEFQRQVMMHIHRIAEARAELMKKQPENKQLSSAIQDKAPASPKVEASGFELKTNPSTLSLANTPEIFYRTFPSNEMLKLAHSEMAQGDSQKNMAPALKQNRRIFSRDFQQKEYFNDTINQMTFGITSMVGLLLFAFGSIIFAAKVQ